MRMPKELQVGPILFRVEQVKGLPDPDTGEPTWGLCDHERQLISIEADIGEDRKAEVFIHEILHAIWVNYNLPQRSEEKCVDAVANGLAALIRSNPKLLKYLATALK